MNYELTLPLLARHASAGEDKND